MLELDRIYNMDCLEGMKQLPDKCIDLVLTDPPYGINKKDIENDNLDIDNYKMWLSLILSEIDRVTSKGYFIFQSEKNLFEIFELFVGHRLFISCNNFTRMSGEIPYSFDPIIFKLKEKCFSGFGRNWFLNDTASQTAKLAKINHPTPKTLDVICYILNLTNAKIILDPFMGSGTTALACKRLNRHFIGFEINPDYCKIAEKRLKNIPERLESFIDIKIEGYNEKERI